MLHPLAAWLLWRCAEPVGPGKKTHCIPTALKTACPKRLNVAADVDTAGCDDHDREANVLKLTH